MTAIKNNSFYFWCCLLQSFVIIGLAFYIGREKTEKEQLLKEKEMNAFTLRVREAEIQKMKVQVDTCHGEKK